MEILSGLTLPELTALMAPLPPYRGRQIFKWIARGAESFEEMTDLPCSLREELASRFTLHATEIAQQLTDKDGTIKLQLRCADNSLVEAVLLQDGMGRKTACISTQVGCPIGCLFCKTGTLGFFRNLSPSEIVDQFFHLQKVGGTISNIVVMGMGEPLLNLEALRKAIDIWTSPEGLNLSHRRITISTSGIVPGITELAEKGPEVRLAVSLTTADPQLRNRLMPINRTYPLDTLKESLLLYQQKQHHRITLEAVLLKGINTRPQDIRALQEFCRSLKVMVNLIPWNPVEGLGMDDKNFAEPAPAEVENFARQLEKTGIPVTIRYKKGRGVSGSCGQLGALPYQTEA
ncbi:23S rRNA (adenine(2503)-C(2))-methyltransferase RlmN [Treponema sp. J25]|jgi:23S rRNA (adenine2503-C2)-methyltransferase|uniref:23S rRNA (adenine(2503)-C(2))-methyltransferase RlmN n=1 Tax=Treponema sp. J25 TaxID=2094121 RepID=UPI001045E4F3|nr:23S rRNA (adenine(2503)-C(2))-methyltransferase RlmN [Treponema sp. J25]TCW60768.1 23S rRNA (adenine(2503)-C(2))-methyltransferase RlmN [Treponema sp. J25]